MREEREGRVGGREGGRERLCAYLLMCVERILDKRKTDGHHNETPDDPIW